MRETKWQTNSPNHKEKRENKIDFVYDFKDLFKWKTNSYSEAYV